MKAIGMVSTVRCVALVVSMAVVSVAAYGQTGANGSASAGAAAGTASTTAMTNVDATLRGSVDSKHAKVGDTVTAMTRSKTRLPNGTILPKRTALTGRVTDVTQYSKGSGHGSVSMLFEQAKMKDGTMMPIHATLRGVSPAAAVGSQDTELMTPVGGAAANSSGGVRTGGSGGLLGGAAGAVGGATGTLGGVTNTATATTGNLAGETAHMAGSTMGTVGSTVRGVDLNSSVNGSASGTISSAGRNVHLESGTTLSLGITAQ